jgi:hypothetical protein
MCVLLEEFLMVKQKEMLEAAFAKLYREFQEKSVQKQATQLLFRYSCYYLFSSEDNYLSSFMACYPLLLYTPCFQNR